jgi:hypothetical protein
MDRKGVIIDPSQDPKVCVTSVEKEPILGLLSFNLN